MGKAFVLFSFIAALGQAQAGNLLHLKNESIDIKKVQAPRAPVRSGAQGEVVESTSPDYYLIQFQKPQTLKEQELIKARGIDILRYVPDDGYIVRGKKTDIEHISGLRGFVAYAPKYRTGVEFKSLSVFSRGRVSDIQLFIFPGIKRTELEDKIEARGFKIVFANDRLITVRTTTDRAPELSKFSGVEWVQEKKKFKRFDFDMSQQSFSEEDPGFTGDYSDLTGFETGLQVLNIQQAWHAGVTGRSQFVVTADTGLDSGDSESLSPDFSNLHLIEVYGQGSNTWADEVGHGTHVLGSVGSSGGSSDGVVTGGAFQAALGMQSMWSSELGGLTVPEDFRVLFHNAYNNGARIHTNSWGSSDPAAQGRYDGDAVLVDEFSWEHPDMLILFAAGNEGMDMNRDGRIDSGSISPPATAKNSLAVGASENLVTRGGIQRKAGEINPDQWGVGPMADDLLSNNPNGLVVFSSRGPTSDGRIKPDVVAPGSNILSNCSSVPESGDLWGRYNDRHCFCGGTSMATPLVAGAAALVRERLLTVQGIENPSSALVKAVMMHTAFDLYPGQFGEIGEGSGQEIVTLAPNTDEGYGRVDVGRAVTDRLFLIDEWLGVGTGESSEFVVLEPINKVTLVYTDYPGAMSAEKALVNDLSLQVIVDNQVIESQSLIDNSEQVRLQSPAAKVRIVVTGVNVSMGRDGRQPYSLVISAE